MKRFISRTKTTEFLIFLNRVAISSIFISSIPDKIKNFDKTLECLYSKEVPDLIASVLLVEAITCLTLGFGFFIFGKNQKAGSVLLLIFLIPKTMVFHVFPLHLRADFMNFGLKAIYF